MNQLNGIINKIDSNRIINEFNNIRIILVDSIKLISKANHTSKNSHFEYSKKSREPTNILKVFITHQLEFFPLFVVLICL